MLSTSCPLSHFTLQASANWQPHFARMHRSLRHTICHTGSQPYQHTTLWEKVPFNYTAPLNQQRLYSHNVIMCCAWCVLLCLQQDAITYTHTFSSKALAMIDICLLITTCCPLSVWLSHSNNSKRIATVVPYRYYSCHTATYIAIPDRIVWCSQDSCSRSSSNRVIFEARRLSENGNLVFWQSDEEELSRKEFGGDEVGREEIGGVHITGVGVLLLHT